MRHALNPKTSVLRLDIAHTRPGAHDFGGPLDAHAEPTAGPIAVGVRTSSETSEDTGLTGDAFELANEAIAPRMRHHPGEVLGERYRVIGLIGSGGAGDVYEVERIDLSLRCALKILRDETSVDPDARRRFLHEARAMARIDSEHVTRIMDFGYLGHGPPFLVMERPCGQDLASLLRCVRRLPPARAVRLAIDACWGLKAVHEAGLVHRDIKPSNLFVTRRDTGGDLCKILDFGICRSSTFTGAGAGQLVGTLRYMAPEQVSAGRVDRRADLYSLAVVLFECLTGVTPHRNDRVERLLFSIMNEEPPRLTEFLSDVPSGLNTIVRRGLARNPKRRFQCAVEFAQALQSCLSGEDWGREPPMPPPRHFLTRRSVGAAAVACMGGLCLVFGSARHDRTSTLQLMSRDGPAAGNSTAALPSGSAPSVAATLEPFPSRAALAAAATELSEVVTTERQNTSLRPGIASSLDGRARDRALRQRVGGPQPTSSPFVRIGSDITVTQIDPRNPYGE